MSRPAREVLSDAFPHLLKIWIWGAAATILFGLLGLVNFSLAPVLSGLGVVFAIATFPFSVAVVGKLFSHVERRLWSVIRSMARGEPFTYRNNHNRSVTHEDIWWSRDYALEQTGDKVWGILSALFFSGLATFAAGALLFATSGLPLAVTMLVGTFALGAVLMFSWTVLNTLYLYGGSLFGSFRELGKLGNEAKDSLTHSAERQES